MNPQLTKFAECLSESHAREIKLARCLAESLKRIQTLETKGGKQAAVIQTQFHEAVQSVAEKLAQHTTETAGALSQRIDGIAQALPVELSAVRSEVETVREMAAKTTGAANIAAAEIAQRMTEIEANFPAQLAALKTEFAKPEAQAAAPQSFNPRGAYEPGEKYKPFDYVSSNGSSYIALVENPTQPPSKKSKQWMLVAARGAGGGVDSGGGVSGLGTAAYRNVGQAAGNVLEFATGGGIEVADASGLNGSISIGYYNAGSVSQDLAILTVNSAGQISIASDQGFFTSGTLALLSQVGDRYLTSSTTSNTIGNGAKTFTVGTGLAYTPTQDITIVFNASNHMHAAVTSYDSATGALVVDVNSHTGSGTYAVWSVNVGGIGAGAIPSGGTTGQVLAKVSSTNYDDTWVTPTVAVGGITGLGTGVATALAVNVGTAGSPVVNGGALGTPSSGTVTNLTGTASININGTVGATTASTGAFTTIDASGLIRLVGTTSSFPALKRNGANLESRLADDSLQAGMVASFFTAGQNSQQGAVSCTNSTGGSVLQLSGSVQYGFHAALSTCFSWGSNATLNGSRDTCLSRVAAGVVGVGSGGSAGDVTGALSLNEIRLSKTITAVATTGAQTINKSSGAVNFAAAASSLVVTNSLVTVNSVIVVSKSTNDATARLGAAVAAAGSFTIYMDVAPAAETRVNFILTN